MLRKCLGFTVSIIPLLSAHATERRAYPGAILSNRSTAHNERSLQAAAHENRFVFIKTEKLAPGAVHLSDKRQAPSAAPLTGRPPLCRTAKVRQIIRSARGYIHCSANNELTATVDPNDTMYTLQYAHTQMKSGKAWDITTGSESLVAVVIDTGIDYNHNDLQANMWTNPREIPNNLKDDDNNGYVDDVYGINAITDTGNPLDDNGHGTHVAGIIGAVGNNARGVVGVNWKVKLAGAKFLSSTGSGSTANAIKSVTYATALKKAGNKVIATNNSWGGTGYSKPLLDAIAAAGDAGVLFVAAAGNSSVNIDVSPFYPAGYQLPNVIAVASTTSAGTLSSFSNFGTRSVHIAAPGSNIYSTVKGNAYVYKSGTSMASPQIAGLAVLTASACDTLDMAAIKTAILTFATQSNYLLGQVAGSRLANAGDTVRFARNYCQDPVANPLPSLPTPAPITTPAPANWFSATPSQVSAGDTVTFKASSGSEVVNYGSVDISLYDSAGNEYVCAYRSYMLLTKGNKTLPVKIPATAKHFPSIAFTFTSNRRSTVAKVEMMNTEPTLVPHVKAEQTCKEFNKQFR